MNNFKTNYSYKNYEKSLECSNNNERENDDLKEDKDFSSSNKYDEYSKNVKKYY